MQSILAKPSSAIGRTYLIGAALSAFIALSFFNTILVADEVFVIFSFGPELVAAPTKIISWAFSSSAGGWSTGRFISPLTHIASNSGVFLNEVTANVLSIDQIQAYSLWRIVMLVALTLSLMKLVQISLSGLDVNQKTSSFVMGMASIIVPSGFVTNRAFSAIRMQTWSYGIITLIAIWLMIALIYIAIRWNKSGRSKSLNHFFVALLALLFATTYELTQTLAPVALIVSNYFFWKASTREGYLNKLKNTILSRFNLLFMIFFSIPFLIIRLDSFVKCANGCYQAASINPAGFSPLDFLGRTVSSFPPIAQSVGFEYESNWLQSGFNLAAFTGSFLAGAVAMLILTSTFKRIQESNPEPHEPNNLFVLALTGLSIILMISIGMALSVAIQTSQDKLSFGASSRDTLILSIGTDLILIYLLSLATIEILRSERLSRLTRLALTSLLAAGLVVNFSLTFVSNTVVTRTTQLSGGAFMQSAIASAVAHPDTTSQGDQVRCALIMKKLMNFPEWEGHDRVLVDGLNKNLQSKIGMNFCSTPIEKLFENYPIK